jgi:NADH-quinone oxidoreductase subunit A
MDSTSFWVLGAYAAAVLAIVAGMVVASHLLGPRHKEKATGEPYESGIVSTGSAEVRFAAKFYLVGMLFVIFDLEAAILFAWAIAAPENGWPAFVAVCVFVAILLIALAYEWREGALDLGPQPRRLRAAARKAGSARRAEQARGGGHALVAD